MKNLIILAVIAAAGYFAYQKFWVPQAHQESTSAVQASAPDFLPPVPGECEGKGSTMKDAIYGYDIGRVSVAQLNFATRSFQSCLRDSGFSAAEINGTVDAMKEDVKSLNPGSSRGY